jgi:hypothetical protein
VRVGTRHGNEQVDWTRASRQGRKLGASAKREGPGTLSGVVQSGPGGPLEPARPSDMRSTPPIGRNGRRKPGREEVVHDRSDGTRDPRARAVPLDLYSTSTGIPSGPKL